MDGSLAGGGKRRGDLLGVHSLTQFFHAHTSWHNQRLF